MRLLRGLSDFLGRLPGVPILVAIGLILLNFVVQLLPNWAAIDWLAQTNLLLHLGLVLGFLGVLLGDVL
ncbi:MAG: hypothetical protein R6X31_12600 [Anaerolineae bacterium]